LPGQKQVFHIATPMDWPLQLLDLVGVQIWIGLLSQVLELIRFMDVIGLV
jgi:hypothetical protein